MAKNEMKQAAALEALMNSNTLTEAAEKAGISRRTLYGYIREDIDFAVTYKKIQEQARIAAAEAATARRAHATEVVEAIMDDETQNSAVRLKAALALLDRADKAEEYVSGLASSHVQSINTNEFFSDPFAPTPF